MSVAMTGKRVLFITLLLGVAVLLAACAPVTTPPTGAPVVGCQDTGSGKAAQVWDIVELDKVLRATPPNGPFWKYGTITMYRKSRKAGMKPVVFAHWSHRAKYACRVCHSELEFSMRSGATGITREQYLSGKYCGACHDGKTAFTVKDGPEAACVKCHMENPEIMESAYDKFATTMPRTPFGNGIDWVTAMRKGKIIPINLLDTQQPPPMPLPDELRKPLKLGTTSPRSDVCFSHEQHSSGLDCATCHPDIFNITKRGTRNFSMEENLYGRYCGSCHMFVAFPMINCQRCHPSMSNY